MNRYWLKIGLGAAAIFCLGSAGMAAVRKGKAEFRSFLSTAGRRIPLQLAQLKFRFDGRSIGAITGIDVHSDRAEDAGKVAIKVALSDLADLDQLRDCSLTVDDIRHVNDRTGFRCADASELEAGDLVKSGDVTFAPGDVTRPLYMVARDVERWRRSDIRSLNASLATRPNGGVQARGDFDVSGEHGPQRGSFDLQADSQGAVISVRDDQGRSLVDFRADQHGVNLNIRDKHGRNLMKLLADSLGAALRIKN